MSVRTYAELVPPPEPEREVVLHMTMEEASMLHALVGRCVGLDLSNVYCALNRVGVRATYRALAGNSTCPAIKLSKES